MPTHDDTPAPAPYSSPKLQDYGLIPPPNADQIIIEHGEKNATGKKKIISDLHIINPYSLGVKSFEDLTPGEVYDHLTNLSKINVNLQAVVVLRTQNIFLINQLNTKNIFAKTKGIKTYYEYQSKDSFDIDFYKPLIKKRWIDPAESMTPKNLKKV